MPRVARVQYLDALARSWARDPRVILIARDLERRRSISRDHAALDQAARLLVWVQALPWKWSPQPDAQVIQLDPAAIVAQGGDCTGKTTLLVAVARVWGIPSQIRWIEDREHTHAHVAPQLLLPGGWTWAEGTRVGIPLGDEPFLD